MGSLITSLTAQAVTVGGYVADAAIAGVGVGIVVYGIRKVWGAFRSM